MKHPVLLLLICFGLFTKAFCQDSNAPEDFGYKNIWVTVKTKDKKKLADALGLRNQKASGWANGVDQAYKDKVFITPAVGQWTMALGWGLLCPGLKGSEDELRCYKDIINRLSLIFGEAELFVTHRVSEYHFWAKSVNGKIVRLYFYIGASGENIDVEGAPTPVEQKLHLGNTLSPEAKRDPNYADRTDLTFPDEEVVMKVAGYWSVNPSRLTERKDVAVGMGLLGDGNPVTR